MNWVDKNGGDSKTLKFIEMSGAGRARARSKRAASTAPISTRRRSRARLEGGKVRVLAQVFDAIAPRFANTGWFTTEDYASKNRDVVEKFARVMADASAYCNAHHADTVAMVAQNAKIDEKLVARMARITFGDYLRPDEIQPLIDVAANTRRSPNRSTRRALISPYALKPPSA